VESSSNPELLEKKTYCGTSGTCIHRIPSLMGCLDILQWSAISKLHALHSLMKLRPNMGSPFTGPQPRPGLLHLGWQDKSFHHCWYTMGATLLSFIMEHMKGSIWIERKIILFETPDSILQLADYITFLNKEKWPFPIVECLRILSCSKHGTILQTFFSDKT
jgi:hypothetical protein